MNESLPKTRPAVVTWFLVYCAVMVFLYLLCVAGGLMLLLLSPEQLEMGALEANIMGALFLGLGLVLTVLCLLPFLVPPRPWVWMVDLVIICLGMTSACFLPVCIPLLIFWIKPETKAYFDGQK